MYNIDDIAIPFISDFLYELICNTNSVEDISNFRVKFFLIPVKIIYLLKV